MKLITRNTDYAIRALVFMAMGKEDVYTTEAVAGALKMPRPFLRKILQTLNRARFLGSSRGRSGGFRLARRPEKISVMELIELFQGPFTLNKCFFKKKICPNMNVCALKKMVDKMQRVVINGLKATTIAGLVAK